MEDGNRMYFKANYQKAIVKLPVLLITVQHE